MKYMLMFVDDQEAFHAMPPEQQGEMYRRIGEWWGKHASEGRVLSGEQLQPPGTATTVRPGTGGEPVTTDGPFIESKEAIGGFAIVEVPDLDEALELARTWPPGGIVEIRPLVAEAGERMSDHEH